MLPCGSGLRLLESLRLWVKDVDFELGLLLVHDGKGGKDRRTVLPAAAGLDGAPEPGPGTAQG